MVTKRKQKLNLKLILIIELLIHIILIHLFFTQIQPS